VPFSVGDNLGPYELLAPLGAGGMGEVWKARDTRLNRMVAIKRLNGPHTVRFEEEARAIAALNHPHICQIHDMGPDYLVLEYIDGQPLKGPMPLDRALRFAAQIAEALEAAHSKGILHRDLKPGNILVAGNVTKLLDFGLAKNTGDDDATRTMGISGTPLYMSPEQAEGKALDARSDIFSFGSVLFEMLAGRRAFDSLAAVLRDDPDPLDSPLAAIITRCLRKFPADRFQSAADLRAALAQVASSPGIQGGVRPSIAVLPFANMSGDKEQEYFSDGLAEEILNLLAKIPSLKVIARTSSFSFRGKEQDIRKIAEALNVKNILEGSVRRSGNRIRVTAQLIDATDGSHLWSERYDRELTDVFAVQDEIAASIASALHLKLTPQPASVERYKPNVPAYEAYLKGRHHSYQITADSMARAKEYFEQAILFDPKFALPYSELARLCISFAIGAGRPATEQMPQLQELAQRALDLHPDLPEAHSCLGMKAFMFDYDWNEAERRFSLAFAREPVPALVCLDYTLYSVALGKAGQAEQRMRHLVEAEPLVVFYRLHLAFIFLDMGRFAEAERECRKILELDQNSYFGWAFLGLALLARGEINEARRCCEKGYSLARYSSASGTLAGLLALTGEHDRAAELLAKLGPPETYGVPMAWCLFHLHQGDAEKAADWMDKAIDQRDPGAVFWLRLHAKGAISSSPHWPALAKRMSLPKSAL
jgi:TolB-like protein/Flp pilus assembly protein TadD/predicted Ser/Thr protein kinase